MAEGKVVDSVALNRKQKRKLVVEHQLEIRRIRHGISQAYFTSAGRIYISFEFSGKNCENESIVSDDNQN